MLRWLVIAALTGMAFPACDKAPLSLGGADAATDSGLVFAQVIVMKEGTGRGLVTSSPGGITCGGTCEAVFPSPTLVTLHAEAEANSVFIGWSGACQGTGPCTLEVRTTSAVTAIFAAQEHRLEVGRAGTGRGRVTSLPLRIDCGDACTATFETGLTVVLSAVAEGDSLFAGWTGACSGTGPCTLVLDEDRAVVAHFDPTPQGLHVGRSGTGTGRVTSSPGGIDCGGICSASFAPGSEITLQAWPDTTSTFAGWSGLCHGTDACLIRMSAAGSVTASFELVQYGLSIDKTGTGSGTITATPAGIATANSCAALYPAGALVTLTAVPDETSVFTGWSGACSGTEDCTVTMDAAKTVDANFEAIVRRLSLAKTGSSNGLVTSIPSGIRCGDTCEAEFIIGAHVLLQATPGPGAAFAGWSGACAGSQEACTVIMDVDRSVTASFR